MTKSWIYDDNDPWSRFLYIISILNCFCFYPFLGGMQYGNTDFTKRLSYGGGGGGGGGNVMPDDPNPGGEGGHGGGLVYLLLDNLTLDGRIESEGTLHDLYTY